MNLNHQNTDTAHQDEVQLPAREQEHASPEALPSESSGKVIQLNLGAQSRNAARDYMEVSVPDSVKTILMVTPTAQLDKMALDNERMFEARYGFRGGKAVRRQIIALQHQYDLTDAEVTTLRKGGQMAIRPKDQTGLVAPDMVAPFAGGVYLVMITAFCLSWLIDVTLRDAPESRKVFAIVMIGMLWVGVIWYTSTRMIGPWQLIKQRIRQFRATKDDSRSSDDADAQPL